MSGYAAAQRMVSTVHLAAQSVGLELFATLDPVEVSAELGSGRAAALIHPPRTTWETWTVQVHAFEVTIVSPDMDPLTAWPILDQLAQDLALPLEIDTARLTTWQPTAGDAWPCVHLTLDTTTHQE